MHRFARVIDWGFMMKTWCAFSILPQWAWHIANDCRMAYRLVMKRNICTGYIYLLWFWFKKYTLYIFSDTYLNARLHHLPIFLFLRYANRHLFAYTEAHAKIKRNLPFIFQNHGPRSFKFIRKTLLNSEVIRDTYKFFNEWWIIAPSNTPPWMYIILTFMTPLSFQQALSCQRFIRHLEI